MPSYPTPSPSPGPTPVPVPTPTPSVQNVALPDIPTNAYQLLLNVADAIDTTHNGLSTSLGRLGDITGKTTTATHTVISTSQGTATDALATLWGNTKIDLNGAHEPLNSIITPSSLGGSPNGLRAVLDQHKIDFQDGILAMEQIQMLQRSCPVQPPSPQQVEEWIQQVHNLTNALGNVSMAMQAIIMAIRSINGGFAAVCATGLVPGQPLPAFNKNAFAMTSNGGGGSGKLSAKDLDTYIEEQGGSEEASNFVSLLAEENNISLDDVKTLIDSGATPDQVYQWLASGKLTTANITDITALANEGVDVTTVTQWLDKGVNLQDTTALVKQGLSSDAVTKLVSTGADLKGTLNDVNSLLNQGVNISDVNQWAGKGLNLKYAKVLLDRGLTVDQVNGGIDQYTHTYTNKDPGYQRFNQISKGIKTGVSDALKRWATGMSTGIGNDGTTFSNRPQRTTNGILKPPFPGNNTGPYTEYYVGSTADRIVVDRYGKAYYYPSDNGHYYPDDAIPIPFDYISQLLGG